MKKIMLVSSAGGHFSELQKLDVFNDSIVVTEKTKNIDNPSYLYLKYSSRQNKFKYPFIFLYNCFLSLKYILKYKPEIIISTGAHSCVSFFYLAKLFKIKTIYIESFAKVYTPSLTYKLIKPVCDYVIVQHEELQQVYQGSLYFKGVY